MILSIHTINILSTLSSNIMVQKSCVHLFKPIKNHYKTLNQWDYLKLVAVIEILFITTTYCYNMALFNIYGSILEKYFPKNTPK